MDVTPGVLGSEVFLEAAIGLIDAAVEDELGRPGLEPLRCELGQKRDRVVVELPEPDRVELAE